MIHLWLLIMTWCYLTVHSSKLKKAGVTTSARAEVNNPRVLAMPLLAAAKSTLLTGQNKDMLVSWHHLFTKPSPCLCPR